MFDSNPLLCSHYTSYLYDIHLFLYRLLDLPFLLSLSSPNSTYSNPIYINFRFTFSNLNPLTKSYPLTPRRNPIIVLPLVYIRSKKLYQCVLNYSVFGLKYGSVQVQTDIRRKLNFVLTRSVRDMCQNHYTLSPAT